MRFGLRFGLEALNRPRRKEEAVKGMVVEFRSSLVGGGISRCGGAESRGKEKKIQLL